MTNKILSAILLLFASFNVIAAPVSPQNGGKGTSGDYPLYVNAPITLSGSASSAFSIDDATKGSRPYPKKTQAERDAIVAPETGLTIYNITTKTVDYFDGAIWQQTATLDHLISGSNISIVDNGDGTVTINSTGGGGGPTMQVQGSFTSINSFTPTNVGVTDTPIAVSGSAFTVTNSVGANVVLATIGGVQTAIIQNNSSGGRWFSVDFDLTMYVPTNSGQVYGFTVYKNTGTPVYFFRQSINETSPRYQHIAIATPMIYLNTNEYVYLTVNSNLPAGPAFYAYYFNGRAIDTTIASIPSTDALLQGSNNKYLSTNGGTTLSSATGAITNGHLAQFSGTSGLVADSGVALSDLTFQYIFDHDTYYPEAIIQLPNNLASWEIDDSEYNQAAIAVSDTGIFTYYGGGLAFAGPSDPNWFLLNHTTNENNTLAQLGSTNKGAVWYPAQTTAQRNAVSDMTNAPQGWMDFNTDQQTLNVWNKTTSAFDSVDTLGGSSVSGKCG